MAKRKNEEVFHTLNDQTKTLYAQNIEESNKKRQKTEDVLQMIEEFSESDEETNQIKSKPDKTVSKSSKKHTKKSKNDTQKSDKQDTSDVMKIIDEFEESGDETQIIEPPKKQPIKKKSKKSTKQDQTKPKKYDKIDFDKLPKIRYGIGAKGRNWTVSVAIPGSLVQALPDQKQMTEWIGHIARICCMFKVNEIIVYSEEGKLVPQPNPKELSEDFNVFFANLLQYAETPPYLRKSLFPSHPDLQYASMMPDLGLVSHLRKAEELKYREGVVQRDKFVYCGLDKPCAIKQMLEPNTRVTLMITDEGKNHYMGDIVSQTYPMEKDGIYWGYKVRVASCFSEIWTQCPYQTHGGYDLNIAVVSKEGQSIDDPKLKEMPKFRHLLIVFGGVAGIQAAVDNDINTKDKQARKYFDWMLNPVSTLGIQPETLGSNEVVMLTLSGLRSKIQRNKWPLAPRKGWKKRLAMFGLNIKPQTK